jgi:DNA polymerase-3 subunit epsilon
MKKNKFLVLDTEGTGLDKEAEIVELALIDNYGKVLINTLIKPISNIPEAATEVHGITTDEAVGNGREWTEVLEQLLGFITSGEYSQLIIYGESYDTRLIQQSSALHGFDIDLGDFRDKANTWCLMNDYARFYGERFSKTKNDKTGYKWQSLVNACKQQNLPVLKAHRALADCQMTLVLANWMDQVSKHDLPHAIYLKGSSKNSSQTESRQSA